MKLSVLAFYMIKTLLYKTSESVRDENMSCFTFWTMRQLKFLSSFEWSFIGQSYFCNFTEKIQNNIVQGKACI